MVKDLKKVLNVFDKQNFKILYFNYIKYLKSGYSISF